MFFRPCFPVPPLLILTRRHRTGVLVQALILLIIGHGAQPAAVLPFRDCSGGNAEALGDLLLGQQSGRAQPLVTTPESVAATQASDGLGREAELGP
jgi:hypothetical protein